MTRSTNQPRWEDIYQRWKQRGVPEVQIIRFEFDNHFTTLPWFSLRDDQQIVSSNPMKYTAWHLANVLPDKPEGFQAAYMISAFLIQVGALDLVSDVLDPVWCRYGEQRVNWWDARARYILPSVDTSIHSRTFSDWGRIRYQPVWEDIIDAAATVWTTIGIELAVVKTPELMNTYSEEYKCYSKMLNSMWDEVEYEKYERLKVKYESQPLV